MKRTYFFWMIIVFSSCINIKDEYPQVEYYQLKQEQSRVNRFESIDGLLLVRDFGINDEVDSEHIIANWDNGQVQRYFYHRWISNCSAMYTDFIVNRFNFNNSFSKGVVKSNSIMPPNFILEGQIIDMRAINSEQKTPTSNYITLSVQINLVKKMGFEHEKSILLNQVYSDTVTRKDNSVKSIAPAFSKGFSNICDMMLIDLHRAIEINKN